jgi:acetamidase/formamidase
MLHMMPHMESGRAYHLGREAIHTYWDNALPPRLTVEPGDTVVFETLEPSQGAVARDIASATWQVPAADPDLVAVVVSTASPQPPPDSEDEERGHALTGPVAVEGAEPGDTLVVEVVEVVPAAWGWTACGPGGGALLQDELEEWVLHVWDLRDGLDAVFAPGIRVPLAPFCGVMGVAPAQPGRHSTIPPRRVGGNLDVRQLTAGATLSLPVEVAGGLFSVGDAHAAQGDGEVAGTGIEMDATVTLRFNLRKGQTVPSPQFATSVLGSAAGPWFAATGHGPDLYEAAREALRGILGYLDEHHGLARPQACILASACVDLRISQVVNGGVFTVSAVLPLAIFRD